MKKNKIKKALLNHSLQEAILFFALSLALLIYSLIGHYTGLTVEWKMSPYLFPLLVSLFLLILSIFLFVSALRELRSADKGGDKPYFNTKNFLATLALAVAYYIALHFVPFIIATVILLAVMLLIFGERRWWVVALVSVLTTGIIYLLFAVGLHVNLP